MAVSSQNFICGLPLQIWNLTELDISVFARLKPNGKVIFGILLTYSEIKLNF